MLGICVVEYRAVREQEAVDKHDAYVHHSRGC
jgi:hypothetical protein